MAKNWIEFELSYCPVKVKYQIIKGGKVDPELKIIIATRVPKQFYYSYLNDAITEAYEHYHLNHS
jgi:hypothetical protein